MTEQVFVARERELSQLQTFLDRALSGQGQVAFVTGEAGSGKTALVTEFTRRAQAVHPHLLVAIGQGDAQTGLGDPYLPFREVLGLLTGDVEAKLAWVAWRGGNLTEARLNSQAALELWQPSVTHPFRWLALWPLIGVAIAQDQISEAVEYARALLEPTQ